MKSFIEIMTKLEIMQEAKYSWVKKEYKEPYERFYLLQLESNIKELEWCLDINQPMTDEDKEESEFDRDQEMRSDMQEEREVYDDDTWDTLSI